MIAIVTMDLQADVEFRQELFGQLGVGTPHPKGRQQFLLVENVLLRERYVAIRRLKVAGREGHLSILRERPRRDQQ